MPNDGANKQRRNISSGIACGWWALIILGACLAYAGARYLGGNGSTDFLLTRIQHHLRVIQSQLADLKQNLVEYRRAHGRYPTNNEGLAALDSFESRFKVVFHFYVGNHEDGLRGFDESTDSFSLLYAKSGIAYFRGMHGRAPGSAAEFRLLYPEREATPWDGGKVVPVEFELAITPSNGVLILSPPGVLSPWLTPYVYENRNTLDPALFADSPANLDDKGRFSVNVDEGVYVYSVGAQLLAQRYDREWWRYHGPRLTGAGLLILAAGLLVALLCCLPGRKAKLGAAAAVLVAGGIGSIQVYATCYAMRSLFYRRDAQMVAAQRELLEKYRSRGVIAEATFRTAVAALEKPLEAGTKDTSKERK